MHINKNAFIVEIQDVHFKTQIYIYFLNLDFAEKLLLYFTSKSQAVILRMAFVSK